VDPDNRLVASELERRWNGKLIDVRRLEDEFEELDWRRPPVLDDEERERLVRVSLVASGRDYNDAQEDRPRRVARDYRAGRGWFC
jgi:hypothetical protein